MSPNAKALYGQTESDGQDRVIANLGMVKRIGLHLQPRVPRYVDLQDLIQAGMVGLVEAARAYDHSKGSTFESYAYLRIKGAMFDEVRRMSSLPRSAVAIGRSHAESERALVGKLGRSATSGELAAFMEKDADELHRERAKAIHFETTSIETLPEPVENISAPDENRPDVQVEHNDFIAALTEAIDNLPEREKLVISLYYVEEMNLKEIGATIGVSESRVSQILTATARSLRTTLQVPSR